MLFGTADGQVIVMDCHGRMLAHVLLHEADGILGMSWNYPAFLVEDSSESDTDSDDYSPPQGSSLLRGGREGARGVNPSEGEGQRSSKAQRPSWEEASAQNARPVRLSSVLGPAVFSLPPVVSLPWSGRGSVICLRFLRDNRRLRTLSVSPGSRETKEKCCAIPVSESATSASLTLWKPRLPCAGGEGPQVGRPPTVPAAHADARVLSQFRGTLAPPGRPASCVSLAVTLKPISGHRLCERLGPW